MITEDIEKVIQMTETREVMKLKRVGRMWSEPLLEKGKTKILSKSVEGTWVLRLSLLCGSLIFCPFFLLLQNY